MHRGALLRAVVLAALLLSLVSCTGGGRPDTAEWLPIWNAALDVVPDEAVIGNPPDRELCQDTLSALRTQTEDLLPTPDLAVDDLVTDWAAIAEAAFFECPPEGEQIDSFSDAYAELATLEESVDDVLSG